MSRRYKEPKPGDDYNRARCPRCWVRLNMTTPYCCQLCEDSNQAQYKRDLERTSR